MYLRLLMVQCLVTGGMVSQPLRPSSLVSALYDYSKKVGSQCYSHVYFNIHVLNTEHRDDVKSFLCN